MTKDKYLKVKDSVHMQLYMSAVKVFVGITYVIETFILQGFWTIIPSIIAVAVTAYFVYEYFEKSDEYKKVLKYEAKVEK